MNGTPEGFEPLSRKNPFTELLGPVYQKTGSSALIVGLTVDRKHCNGRGIVLGGVLGHMPISLWATAWLSQLSTSAPLVTTSQTIDYVAEAERRDWIEVHKNVQKVGRNTAFANYYFHVGSKRIAGASAVFSVVA